MNFKTMIIGAVFALGLGTIEANAAVTYTYIGDKLTYDEEYQDQFNPINVTGILVLSKALDPNLDLAYVNPLSFSYFADHILLNEHTSLITSFQFSTDSVGKITGWRHFMRNKRHRIHSSSAYGDGASFATYSALSDTPGSWTQVAAAVPEPATWAMMIIGFGAVGSMVRTSRRRNAFSAA